MTVSVDNRQSHFHPKRGWIKNHCLTTLERLDLSGYELSVSLVEKAEMAELNRKYLGKEGTTDVLAFPLADLPEEKNSMSQENGGGKDLLGDVVICPAAAFMEEGDLDAQMLKLLVHGILHLAGYDHYSIEEKEQMFTLQDEILRTLT